METVNKTYDESGVSGEDNNIQCVLTFEERIIVASLTFVITTIGLIGNAAVIVSVLLSKKLHTTVNVFVLNLCVADLLTCITGPLMVAAYMSTERLIIPSIVCASVGFVTITCIGCSIYTLATIAINRLLRITSPNKLYTVIYTRGKIAVIIIIIWFVPLSMASLPPVFGFGQLGYDQRFSTCTWDPTHPKSRSYGLLLSAVVYPVSLTIISVCYLIIFCKIRKHKASVVQPSVSTTEASGRDSMDTSANGPNGLQKIVSRRQMQVTRNMFLVVLIFVVCLTPYGTSLFAPNSDEFIVYAGQILLANSMINPIIYGTKHPDFKIIMRCVLGCRLQDIPNKTSICKSLLPNN